MIPTGKCSGESGYTLTEVITASAVLSVLMLGLGQFYGVFVRASAQVSAYQSVNRNLQLVTRQITKHLRTAGRNSDVRGLNPYEFVGINGAVPGFEDSDTTPHGSPGAIPPHRRSDRLHFHGFESYADLNPDTVTARTYVAFWVNGEEAPKPERYLRNKWGVLMRKQHHSNAKLVPYYPGNTTNLSPKLDLNTEDESHWRTNVIADNVDYLSFRYYDPVTDRWVDSWNTIDPSKFPGDSRIPSAVRLAVRGYDPRANDGSSRELRVSPQWNRLTVSLRAGR